MLEPHPEELVSLQLYPNLHSQRSKPRAGAKHQGGALPGVTRQFTPSGATAQDPAGSAGVATLAAGMSQDQMGKLSLKRWLQ